MVAELIERSNRYLDEGVVDGEYNPMTLGLHELGDGLAMVDGFSHVITFDTGDGLVAFETSLALMAPGALRRIWAALNIAELAKVAQNAGQGRAAVSRE